MNAMASHRPTRGWRSRSSLGAVLVAASAWLSASVWAANSSGLVIEFRACSHPKASQSAGFPNSRPTSSIGYLFPEPGHQPRTPSIRWCSRAAPTSLATQGPSTLLLPGPGPNCPQQLARQHVGQVSVMSDRLQLKSRSTAGVLPAVSDAHPEPAPKSGSMDSRSSLRATAARRLPSTYEKGLGPYLYRSDHDRPGRCQQEGQDRPFAERRNVLHGLTTHAANPNNKCSTTVDGARPNAFVTTNQIRTGLLNRPSATSAFRATPGYYCLGTSSTIDIRKAIEPTKSCSLPALRFWKSSLRQDASSLAVIKPFPAIGAIKIFYSVLHRRILTTSEARSQIATLLCRLKVVRASYGRDRQPPQQEQEERLLRMDDPRQGQR